MNNEINYKLIAQRLWQILDDIDTSFDHYKPNMNDSFVNYVDCKVRERSLYANSKDGQNLVFNPDIPVLESDDPMVKWFKDAWRIETSRLKNKQSRHGDLLYSAIKYPIQTLKFHETGELKMQYAEIENDFYESAIRLAQEIMSKPK